MFITANQRKALKKQFLEELLEEAKQQNITTNKQLVEINQTHRVQPFTSIPVSFLRSKLNEVSDDE